MSEAAQLARSQRQRWAMAGSSHDRLIGILRIVLPVAVVLLFLFLLTAPLLGGRDISFVLAKDRVQVAKERMRVADALYRGTDSRGQPFALKAGSAVQVSSRDPVVRLNDLAAEIVQRDGPATVRARSGRYDMSREQVAVDGQVVMTAADGYRLETRDVTVDLKTRRAVSGGAVDGRMPLGTFSANRLSADLAARTVRLDGRARLRIVQGVAR
ncbi:LPS export ABC transporter periplasmic protein LptC [Sphingomonas sp. 1P06PA]|uniref:LPS export ABC transporter periplasmic protein LptC n=1 Tax=Sphingomonas sp. 1P06PA TaxID=554121 RepID=UPI0039A52A13